MSRGYVDELVFVMQQVWRFVAKQQNGSFEERKATMLQFSALRFLSERTNATMTVLSSSLTITLSSATQLVERMAKAGFVRKMTDKSDKRITHVRITEMGKKQMEAFQKEKSEKMKRVFSKISNDDLRELLRIQKTLLAQLRLEQTE